MPEDFNLTRDEFLKFSKIPEEKYQNAGYEWETLLSIAKLHIRESQELITVGQFVVATLQALPAVHSTKLRIKDPARLLEKIIRKKIEKREITPENYRKKITDLVGVRAIHLYKNDWREIHHFVMNKWPLAEKPIAYHRAGDPQSVLDDFKSAGCRLKKHPAAYRSVHYLLKSQPTRQNQIVELQVRTIFEEGWSEIDHRIRYAQEINPFLAQFLMLFNGLAGSADEMATYIKNLTNYIRDLEVSFATKQRELDSALAQSTLEKKEKEKLQVLLDQERKSRPSPDLLFNITPSKTLLFGSSDYQSKAFDVTAGSVLGAAPSALGHLVEDSQKIFGSWTCERCHQSFPNMLRIGDSNLCSQCKVLSSIS